MSVERNTPVPAGSHSVIITGIGSVDLCGPDYLVNWSAEVPTLAYMPKQEIYTPNSTGSRKFWKSFEHFRSDQASPEGAMGAYFLSELPGNYPGCHGTGKSTYIGFGYDRWLTVGLVRPFGDAGRLDADLPSFVSNLLGGFFIPPPADLEVMSKAALASILPIVKAELSLPNFIHELKDFKRPLAKALAVLKSGSFISALKKLGLFSKKKLTFKQMLQGAAGNYLNLQFNILPLISDIAKIRLAMSRTQRRINDFVSREGRPQNRHYSFKWSEFPDDYSDAGKGGAPSWQNHFGITSCGCERTVTYDPSVFHVQVQYNYNYTGYQRENALLLGHLDALGLNLNPAIIWNAIPWTFVVDWMLGVGPYLDSLKSTNMEPQINIRQALWSITRRRRIVVTKATYGPGGVLLWKGQMPVVEQSAYRRSVGLPSLSSITSSGLTAKEVSLGAALVIVQGRNRKKH
jgi:hypothetical protein